MRDDRRALEAHAEFSLFLRWITDKPPDFHAPTRRKRIG